MSRIKRLMEELKKEKIEGEDNENSGQTEETR